MVTQNFTCSWSRESLVLWVIVGVENKETQLHWPGNALNEKTLALLSLYASFKFTPQPSTSLHDLWASFFIFCSLFYINFSLIWIIPSRLAGQWQQVTWSQTFILCSTDSTRAKPLFKSPSYLLWSCNEMPIYNLSSEMPSWKSLPFLRRAKTCKHCEAVGCRE